MQPLISVIVPIYNIEGYIQQCVASLMKQTFSKIEIVLVNDGSTDKSAFLIDEFKEKDSRVQVFHKKNGGLAHARNLGIAQSQGELISFVDGDDWVEETYIENLYDQLKKNDCDICCAAYWETSEKGELLQQAHIKEKVYSQIEGAKAILDWKNISHVAWGKLFKKSLFVNNNLFFPVGITSEDLALIPRIYFFAKKTISIDQPLYFYRHRDSSIVSASQLNQKYIMDRIKAAKILVEFMIEKNNFFVENEFNFIIEYVFMDILWRLLNISKRPCGINEFIKIFESNFDYQPNLTTITSSILYLLTEKYLNLNEKVKIDLLNYIDPFLNNINKSYLDSFSQFDRALIEIIRHVINLKKINIKNQEDIDKLIGEKKDIENKFYEQQIQLQNQINNLIKEKDEIMKKIMCSKRYKIGNFLVGTVKKALLLEK